MNTVSLEDCWPYAGIISNEGYGLVYCSGKLYRAHRVMYEDVHGELPKDIVLDHLCRVRHCVNPSHLEATTHDINKARGFSPAAINARRTHCRRGHEYTPENTRVTPKKWRECRTCRRMWWLARRDKRNSLK